MPAKSQDQKEFMQLALAVKKGKKDKSEVSQDVVDAAESMSTSELEKYAKGPVKERLRRVVREEIESVLKEDHLSENQLDQLNDAIMRLENGLNRVANEIHNVNMIYGDGGAHSDWLSSFVDNVDGSINDYSHSLRIFKDKVKQEYPDYNWNFM